MSMNKYLKALGLFCMLGFLAAAVICDRTDAGWSVMTEEVAGKAFWGSSPADMFTVGCLGLIRHYDGSPGGEWTEMPSTHSYH